MEKCRTLLPDMALSAEKFKQSLAQVKAVQGKTYLLACSGGCDSMVLMDLLLEAGITFEAAHVNYGLRGKESNGDEALVKQQCELKNIPLHIFRADANSWHTEKPASIQMTARSIRYDWFKQLIQDNKLEGVFTAHHKNDQAETVLLNLARGTGLKGLRGMLPVQGDVRRPLLDYSSLDIRLYATENKISYRDDSSNSSTKYKRNFIRHKIMPLLEKINSRASDHIASSAAMVADAWELLDGIVGEKNRIFEPVPGKISRSLEKEPKASFLLYHFLEKYGLEMFTGSVLSPNTGVGAIFHTADFELLVDREYWFVREKKTGQPLQMLLSHGENIQWGVWKIKAGNAIFPEEFPSISEAVYLDATNLYWPLAVRTWKEGDSMRPLGMKGRKKVSDIFTESRLSRFEKEQVPVICSGEDIICIPGLRVSENYRARTGTPCVRLDFETL